MSAPRPSFTVAVCTWNRAPMLARALDAMRAMRVPDGLAWELLVVDNGSIDETPRVLARAAPGLPLRVVREPRPGLSMARNAAVRAASGDYILWTDDDALVEPGWLEAYAGAAARWPECAIFGGPIAPHFDAPPPAWLVAAMPAVENAFSLLDLGPEPVPLDPERLPFGANYMVRSAEQRRWPYDPRLGRCRGAMRGGEEAAVLHALLRAGARGRWVPGARVRHLVPKSRQSVRHLRAYYMGNVPHDLGECPPPGRRFLGRPLWVWRQAVEHEVRYWAGRARRDPGRWAPDLRLASMGWGLLLADWRSPASRDRRRDVALAPHGGD